MAVWRFVDFSVERAQTLADLTGVERDLVATIEMCDRTLSEYAKPTPEMILIESLCAAAIIRYGRTFSSGVRAGVPFGVIEKLDRDSQAAHKYFKDLRDKWAAHSVNSFEENRVVAYLTPEEHGVKKVACVTVQQNRVSGLGGREINKLKELCEKVLRSISVIIEEEAETLLNYAQSLPVDELYRQDEPEAFVPGQGSPSKSRRKLGK